MSSWGSRRWPVRERLLAIQTEFYEKLRAQLDADHSTKVEDREQLAVACESLASVLAASGLKDRAITLYRQSLAIRETLDQTSKQRRRDRARVYADLGLLLSEVGPEREAAFALDRSIDLRSTLLDEVSADAELRRELARSWADLAILHRDHGHLTEAERAFEKSRGLLEPRANQRLNDPPLRAELGRTLLNLAILRYEFSRPAEALADATRTRELASALTRDRHEGLRARSLLGRALDRQGVLLADTGHLDEAQASLEGALEVRRGLAKDHPLFADFRDDLAATLGNLSNVQTARHDAGATQSLDEAGRILAELTERYGFVVRYQDDFASYHHTLALRHVRDGNMPAAVEAMGKARAIRETLLEKDPHLTPVRKQLAKTLYNEGRLRFLNNQPAEALRRLGGALPDGTVPPEPTAVGILADLVGESPDDLEVRSLLGEVRDLLGQIDLQIGHDAQGVGLLRSAAADHRTAFAAATKVKRYRRALIDHDTIVLQVARSIMDRDARLLDAPKGDQRAWLCKADELVLIAREMARCVSLESRITEDSNHTEDLLRKRCTAEAILALDLALRAGFRHETLDHSPDFDPLRGEAGFQKLFRKSG